MISALLVSTLLGAGPASPVEVIHPPSGHRRRTPEGDLSEAIKTVRRTFLEDGLERVSATGTHRVISHADGSLELQGAQPLKLALESITRATSCRTTMLSRVTMLDAPNAVRSLRSCDVEESWTNTPVGLEHAFTILRAPAGTGALTLFVRVDGPWHHSDDDGHVFKGPGAAHALRYGRAFVLRGARRIELEVVHVEGGLELRVPASIAEAPGAFPMEIDPVLSAEFELDPDVTYGPSPAQEETPAIAVNSVGTALVVWADTRRALGADLFGARISSLGMLVDQVGFPINVAPGHQVRPAVSADGLNFLVAWDVPIDGGYQIRARSVSSTGALGTDFPVALGSQPALASAGDGGYFMAFVDPTQQAQVIPLTSSGAGVVVTRPAVADERASRPAIAASSRGWFAAWETNTSAGGSGTSIRGMSSNPAASPNIIPVYDNQGLVAARRPTVALATVPAVAEDVFVFWEEGLNTPGRRISNSSGAVAFSFLGSSPSLARTSGAPGALPTLGSFVAGRLQFRDFNDAGVSSIAVGPMPGNLVLAANPRVFAAWTESPRTESDVYGAALINATSTTQKFLISNAVNSQRGPRVAIVDSLGEGIAVWIDGTTVIYGAKVVEDPNGLRFGNRFHVYTSTQTLQQVEVAAVATGGMATDTNFLVTWRQSGLSGIMGQLTTTSAASGPSFVLSASAVSVGPAVAWDQGSQAFQVAWNQGTEMVTRTVTQAGVIGAVTTRSADQARDVAINCLRTNCLLAWERPSNDLTAVLFGSIAPAPYSRSAPAGNPAIANDGTDFYLGWHSATGLSFAKVNGSNGTFTDLSAGVVTASNAAVTGISMASAIPPVVVWAELTSTEQASLYIQRLDFQAPVQTLGAGFNPSVAIGSSNTQPSGIAVYQRYLGTGTNAMRAYAKAFSYAPDAGYADGGRDAGFDAGVADAGAPDADGGADGGADRVDAGSDAGSMMLTDAGVDGGGFFTSGDGGVFMFGTSGCGCQSSSGAPLLSFVLLLALRRRQRSASRS